MPATVWKGYLSFGLVSFPIRLSAAARGETVHFHLLHKKDLSRVKEVMFCAAEDKPLERSDLVKGYESSKGEYIVIEPEELEKVAPPTATAMQILQFVRIEDVDPIFLEKSYYVAPEEAVSRPYSLSMPQYSGRGVCPPRTRVRSFSADSFTAALARSRALIRWPPRARRAAARWPRP